MTDEEYEISKTGLAKCPRYNLGKKSNFRCVCKGPMHDEIGNSCFCFCNVESNHLCGQCVNWVGNVTTKDKRSDVFGHCFYQIIGVGAWWPTDCPHFEKRTDNTNYLDWVEDKVITECGHSDSSLECREARIRARKKWAKMYP